MSRDAMKALIEFINRTYTLTAVPIHILSEKRWASDDSLFKSEPLDGMPQRIKLSEDRGVIIYDWDELTDEVIADIKAQWDELIGRA